MNCGIHSSLHLESGKAVAKAWQDPAFRSRLIEDPISALDSLGIQVPEGVSVRILEDSDQVTHRVERLTNP